MGVEFGGYSYLESHAVDNRFMEPGDIDLGLDFNFMRLVQRKRVHDAIACQRAAYYSDPSFNWQRILLGYGEPINKL